jgi:hypothetical protein
MFVPFLQRYRLCISICIEQSECVEDDVTLCSLAYTRQVYAINRVKECQSVSLLRRKVRAAAEGARMHCNTQLLRFLDADVCTRIMGNEATDWLLG